MRELICIVCPNGCHLKIDEKTLEVTGNKCERGRDYASSEITHPTRVVTSTVKCTGGSYPRCPVKTDKPIPKELIFDVMAVINSAVVTSPCALGTVVCENVCGTDANVVTTKEV